MSRVVEGFYVRFFWDWLAFISGAFRWKVFAVFADYVGDASSLSPHAALLTPCPIAINAALDTVVNIRRGLMNGRQISSMEPLLFPFFSSPVDGSIKLIRPSVIMRTSSTLSRALLNHPTDISSGTSITTVCRCCMHCSAAFSTHGLILLYGGLPVRLMTMLSFRSAWQNTSGTWLKPLLTTRLILIQRYKTDEYSTRNAGWEAG